MKGITMRGIITTVIGELARIVALGTFLALVWLTAAFFGGNL